MGLAGQEGAGWGARGALSYLAPYPAYPAYQPRFRLNGELATGEWLTARLRGIAPEMWLEESLLAGLDRAALDRVAMRERFGSVNEIRLREGATLDDLERVLESRLPVIANLKP